MYSQIQCRRHILALIAAALLLLGGALVESFSATTKPTTASSTLTDKTTPIKGDSMMKLRQYQTEVSAPLAFSFEPSSFNPFPPFSNQHVQTIVATFLRQIPEINYFHTLPDTLQAVLQSENTQYQQFWDSRERFDTPDGDFFHVDYKSSPENKGMVVLCHGLESNSDSNLSRDMALAYHNKGLNVACINFRGCSEGINDLLGGYHLGFTDDVLYFLDVLKTRFESEMQPIYLSGFSLGANVILKALGELGMEAVTKYNIQGATAFCVPFDAERNAPFLGQPGFNQIVYCGNLLKTLKQRAKYQLNLHCDGDVNTDKFDYEGVLKAKTITDFDEAFVARIYGFDSAIDYYRKTSCIRFLPDIAVPTFILTARDDPFMDGAHFPIDVTQAGGGPAPIKMAGTQHGGHCGYIFHQVDSKEDILETSWSSTQLARFFEHLMKQKEKEE